MARRRRQRKSIVRSVFGLLRSSPARPAASTKGNWPKGYRTEAARKAREEAAKRRRQTMLERAVAAEERRKQKALSGLANQRETLADRKFKREAAELDREIARAKREDARKERERKREEAQRKRNQFKRLKPRYARGYGRSAPKFPTKRQPGRPRSARASTLEALKRRAANGDASALRTLVNAGIAKII